MARYDVHRNSNVATARTVPYLLDVQHGLFEGLATRIVIPLVPAAGGVKPISRLNPVFEIEGRRCLLLTPEMAGVPTRALGPVVSSLSEQSGAVLGAIDFLLTGV